RKTCTRGLIKNPCCLILRLLRSSATPEPTQPRMLGSCYKVTDIKKPAEAGFFTTRSSRQFNQQLVETAHISGRILQAVAGCQGRLIEQNVRQIAEALVALLIVEFLDQRVSRVEFEDRLRIR